MLKRVLCILTSLALVLAMMPSAVATTASGDNCALAGITSGGLDRYLVSWYEYSGATYYKVIAYVPNSESSSVYNKYAETDYTTGLETTIDVEDGQDYLFYVYAYDSDYNRLDSVDYYRETASATASDSVTFTFTIPAGSLFGYASSGDYMELTLPTSLSAPTTVTTTEEVLDHYEKVTIYGTSTIISAEAYAELSESEQAEYTAIESTSYTYDTVINYYELNLTADEVDALDDDFLKTEDGTVAQVITVDRYNVLLAFDEANGTAYTSYYDAVTVTVLAGTEITIDGYVKTVETAVTETITVDDYALLSEDEQEGYVAVYATQQVTSTTPVYTNLPVSYTLTIGGVTISLKSSDGYESSFDTYTQTVDVGMMSRNYMVVNDVAYNAMFAEGVIATSDSITITATVDISGYSDDPTMTVEELYAIYGSPLSVEYYDANDILIGSLWYISSLLTTKALPMYSVTSSSVTGGTITTDLVSAASGLTVTVNATADSGYELSGITVTDTNGASVEVTDCGEGTYTFTMPSIAVTVSATFEAEATEPAESETHTHTTATVIENYVAATATTDGSYDSVTYCTECGEIISESHTVIAAYGSGIGETIDWATVLADSIVTIEEDTTTSEEVAIDEPVEPTDTETEDDGEEEPAAEPAVEAETPAETNPTTGIAISLIPMAIAALAAVSSKRR